MAITRSSAQGLRNLYNFFASFIHHESASRGSDQEGSNQQRLAAEAAIMKQRWGALIADDPVYSPNPRSRMGIKEGIHGRMAEVGGHATIHSDIVGGTAVTLTWNPIPHAARIGPSGRRWLSLIALPSVSDRLGQCRGVEGLFQ